MSNKILNLVRDARLGDPTMKEVLKVIADQSNDAGTGVWSSYAYIAWCVERGRSTVIDKCNQLRNKDILSVVTRHGNTNLWSISIDALEDIGEEYRKPIEVNEIGSPEPGLSSDETSPEPGLDQSSPKTPVVQPQDPSPLEPLKEPTYIPDDGDGVPLEHIMVYHDILVVWKEKFPKKRQPQPTNVKMQRKVKARLKVPSFKERLWAALLYAENSPSLMKDSWFQLEYLLRNDDNYEKVASGEFDWKDEGKLQQEAEATRRKATADHGGDLEEFKKANPGGT